MFIELAALVHLQGELIDNIEANIATAKNDVIAAEEDIIQSHKNMKSARKKKCIIVLIVVGILICIVLPIIGVKVF